MRDALAEEGGSDAAGWGLISNAAYPGYARTELIANGPGDDALMTKIGNVLVRPFLSQSAAGAPGPAVIGAQAKDLAVASAASSTDCGTTKGASSQPYGRTLVRPAITQWRSEHASVVCGTGSGPWIELVAEHSRAE